MIKLKHPQDLTRLRRMALDAQGLLQNQPFGRGLTGARLAIGHLGYVQIDTISVVERAHHHVLHTRVPGYHPSMINQMLIERDIFEYWTHAAAFLPITDFRFSLPYKHAIKRGKVHYYKDPDAKLKKELLARIQSDGPIKSRDIESDSKKSAGWWNWKPAKKVLEQLYMEGDLMVSNREGFQKSYDLTERVLPANIDLRTPNSDELAAHILEQQLRCHGIVSLKGLTYQRREPELRTSMLTLLNERLSQQVLELVQLDSGETYMIEKGALERPLPRACHRVSILSPFDNCVIQRERLRILFHFDYQLECYLPQPKRKFGYFCLPILYRDSFIGRMDCKAHRKSSLLEVKSLHLEPHNYDEEIVISEIVKAIARYSHFQGCDSVSLVKMYPTRLFQHIRKSLAQLARTQ